MAWKKFLVITLLLAMLLLGASGVLARVNALDIPWWTVDGGGGTSTGGNFTFSGTIGQPDAGLMAGGHYILRGGFWVDAAALAGGHVTHLPLILKAP